MEQMIAPKKKACSKTKLARTMGGIMGASLVGALVLLGCSTVGAAEDDSTISFNNLDSLDRDSRDRCVAAMKQMKMNRPTLSVDCARIAEGARDFAADAAAEWKRLTADDIAEVAGTTALAMTTAADAAQVAMQVAAAAAASQPDAAQIAAIAAAVSNMDAETAAKAADVFAAAAAKHALNARTISRALMKMAATAADATHATLGAATQDAPFATESESDQAVLRASVSRRTMQDATNVVTVATDAVESAILVHTDAVNAWRHAVVAQGDEARQGAAAGMTAAQVAAQAGNNDEKVELAFYLAELALTEVASAVAKEMASLAKLTTARALARGTTGLCVKVPEGYEGLQPMNLRYECDASALGPAYATIGNCGANLESGTTCKPVCLGGYRLVNESTCSATGDFTGATCELVEEVGSCASLAKHVHARVADTTELWKKLTADDATEAAELAAVAVKAAADATALAVATAAQGAIDAAATATTGITKAGVAALAAQTLALTVSGAADAAAANAARHASNLRAIARALAQATSAAADATAADLLEAAAAASPPANNTGALGAADRAASTQAIVDHATEAAENATADADIAIQAMADADKFWRHAVLFQNTEEAAKVLLAVQTAAQGAIDVANNATTGTTTAEVAAAAEATTADTALEHAANVAKVAAAAEAATEAAVGATDAVARETAAHVILTGTRATARGTVGLCVRI